MKTLITFTILLCFTISVNAADTTVIYKKDKEKRKAKNEEDAKENPKEASKNFHTIKKWKMKIVYKNGDVISKTIVVAKNSSLSAMETAFQEAEKYIKTLKRVEGYEVSPITNNQFVLLAH